MWKLRTVQIMMSYYMMKWGKDTTIANNRTDVRSYSRSEQDHNKIQANATNSRRCYKCGTAGHMIGQCGQNKSTYFLCRKERNKRIREKIEY